MVIPAAFKVRPLMPVRKLVAWLDAKDCSYCKVGIDNRRSIKRIKSNGVSLATHRIFSRRLL